MTAIKSSDSDTESERSPPGDNIPPTSTPSSRRPANIPLHTLSSAAPGSSNGHPPRRHAYDPDDDEDPFLESDDNEHDPLSYSHTTLIDRSNEKADRHPHNSTYDPSPANEYQSPPSCDSFSGSDFSFWSDTGDLVDQLAAEEDPLTVRLAHQLDELDPSSGKSRGKAHKRVRKEDIPIPSPPPRKISRGERLLAAIMSPRDGPSRLHGLHGKKLIYFTSVFVSLGVFLFGYDQGVMSGIITGGYFKDYFNQPSRAEIGTMVAILEVGAFISSLMVGRVGDIIGRRKTILYGSIVFVVGGALQAFANGMPMMMVGRILAGFGVGMLSTIVPIYQSEISPPHNRGKLACIEFTGNITGYCASVWVDYFCSFIHSDLSWRIPLFMQVFLGTLLGLGSFLILESPRWLLDNDHDEEGIVVIANLYGKGDIHNPKARENYREIKMNVLMERQEGERSYGDMFKRYYKRVFIAMSAQALAQLNGINVISYYAPLVFEQAGWQGRDAILMTGINGITYLLSTIPPWYIVDKYGRRPILLTGAVAMMLSLSAVSYFIFIDIDNTASLVVVFVMIYNAAFGASWGPIPWLYPPEILPLSIRAKGASLSTATNWAFNWLVGMMTPVLQELIQWRLYLVHAFFCALSFVIVWFIYPETANIRLEDMNVLFGDATSVMPTPETIAEAESLFSGNRSPVPSIDLRRGPAAFSADNAIPGLNIDPPVDVEGGRGKPQAGSVEQEGVGGWISSIVKRAKGSGEGDSGSGKYSKVKQDDGDEEDGGGGGGSRD
ncbi:high affinity glucose transporter [Eremomyces bilateralis CBS 781.70]|uniref:High affinity glucose transporter n=1 Tax=Eremomyces bilateralis CBS 781.70 TaxID=1392243 RepID=A0A6G1FWN6_9PEZI|nr:high affinity glucose transporter [Eremomyces bilateralis CBS 781.70]KAF1810148.1 high affinity glucose transporter [Eremomyces bilateralis CBS 781.70]